MTASAKRAATSSDLWAAFRSTWLRIDTPEGLIEVRPAPRGTTEGIFPEGIFAGANTVHIVTAWNPGGEPCSPKQNRRRQKELLERLAELGLEVNPAAGLAPDGSWAEASSASTGTTRDVAVELGREFGQLAIFEWTSARDGLRVVRCDNERAYRAGWTSSVLDHRYCPMRPPADRALALCRMNGGPWTGSSQRAGAEWTVRRWTMLRALGCDVCHGGPVATAGRPVILAPTQDPARANTSVWLNSVTLPAKRAPRFPRFDRPPPELLDDEAKVREWAMAIGEEIMRDLQLEREDRAKP